MMIISHRGINTLEKYTESSLEAFESHLKHGFGLEFDVNFSKDGKVFIFHDSNLSRITNDKINDKFIDLTLNKIKSIKLDNGHFCDFDELLMLVEKYNTEYCHFLHLKGIFQDEKYLNILIEYLEKYSHILSKFVIFDVKPEWAKLLKSRIPNIQLGASVSHPYDIKRFNKYIFGTLMDVKTAIEHKNIYDWVWLDEWDRIDVDNGVKNFYNKEVFTIFKKEKMKIGLVTPELHSQSPALLGGESHQDAQNKKMLFKRISSILKLKPDAICTDYPDDVLVLIND